jgi:hypothetical protein
MIIICIVLSSPSRPAAPLKIGGSATARGVYLIVEADDVEEARRQVGQGHLAERPVLDQVTQCLGGLLKGEGPVTGGRDLAACDQRQDRGVRLCLRITPT